MLINCKKFSRLMIFLCVSIRYLQQCQQKFATLFMKHSAAGFWVDCVVKRVPVTKLRNVQRGTPSSFFVTTITTTNPIYKAWKLFVGEPLLHLSFKYEITVKWKQFMKNEGSITLGERFTKQIIGRIQLARILLIQALKIMILANGIQGSIWMYDDREEKKLVA